MSVFHILGLKLRKHKLKPGPFLEHIYKFHLDPGSPRYSTSTQVSYLGMNSGRGWNPNLEGSYLLEYSEYEAKFRTQCKSGFYIRPIQFLTLDPSSISGYGECTKT